jgi:hypothetical protein
VLVTLVLLLALFAYFQGDGRHLSGLSKGTKMLLAIFPAFVCASLISGYIRQVLQLLPPLLLHGPFGAEESHSMNSVSWAQGFLRSVLLQVFYFRLWPV